MFAKYLKKSIAERSSFYADEKALCLHATFSGSMQDMILISEKIYNDFICPSEKYGIFDSMTDCCKSVKVGKLHDTFASELNENRRSLFISDFHLKTDNIKTKKDIKMRQKKLLSIGGNLKYENKIRSERFENAKKWANQFDKQLQQRELVKKLLHCRAYIPIKYQGMADAQCFFSVKLFGNQYNLYKGDLSLRIRTYSLENQINEAAEYLKCWLKDICIRPFFLAGYVCKGNFFGQYDTPQMEFFNDYHGEIVDLNDGRKFLCKEWLEANYAEGIEWANAFSCTVAEKIDDTEYLKNHPNIEYMDMENGTVFLSFSKPIEEFQSKDAEEIYSSLKSCLRPGFYSYRIKDLVRNVHDIPVCDDMFEVENDRVHFSRGSFDFLTSPVGIEEVNLSGAGNYDEVCSMLESKFQVNCEYFSEDILSEKDMKKMIAALRAENVFPLMICTDSPVLDYLEDCCLEKENKGKLDDTLSYEESCFDRKHLENRFSTMNSFFFGKAQNQINGHIENGKNRSLILLKFEEYPEKFLKHINLPALNHSDEWYKTYGAVPVVIGIDSVEYQLEEPIAWTRAIEVAIEHFMCASDDISMEMVPEESILKYAADLVKSEVWVLNL